MSKAMFVDYHVKIRFTSRLCGTIPTSKESQEAFLKSLKIPSDEADQAKESMLAEAVAEDIPVEESCNTFKRDENGLFIEGRQVKAAIKESAVILDYTAANNPGRQYFQHGVHVSPEKLYLGKDEIDGTDEQFGTVWGRQGQRAIITRRDYVEPGCSVSFTVRCVVGKNFLSAEKMAALLECMQDAGMGSARPQGYGRFIVLEAVEKTEAPQITITKERKKRRGAA